VTNEAMNTAFRRLCFQAEDSGQRRAFKNAKLGEPSELDRKWFSNLWSRAEWRLEGPYSRDDLPALIEWFKSLGEPIAFTCLGKFSPSYRDAAQLEVMYELVAKLAIKASELEYYAPKKVTSELTDGYGCDHPDCPQYNVNCFYDPEFGGTNHVICRVEGSRYDLCSSCCGMDMCDGAAELGFPQSIDFLVTIEPAEIKIPKHETEGKKNELIADVIEKSLSKMKIEREVL